MLAWVACLHGWSASLGCVGGMGGVLSLNVERLLLNLKWKTFQIDLNSDIKEEPGLKSRCDFTLFEPVMSES